MKTVTAIRHLPFEDLGSWAPLLMGRGFRVRYLDAGVQDLSRLEPTETDLLVILGGPIGACDEADYPFLSDELRLLEARLGADRPTLGICLGSQLMARALGARVFPDDAEEIGWAPLTLSDAGRESCLASLDGSLTPVFHWHSDSFELPQGARLLASTDKCRNQAFAFGDKALALQFHPEVTARGLEQWYIGHARSIAANPALSVRGLRAEAQRFADDLQPAARHCLEQWLLDVRLLPPAPAGDEPDIPAFPGP